MKLDRTLIGMIHLLALPGTPGARHPLDQVVDQALREAEILTAAGFEALLVENMGDRPYLNRGVGPEVTAAVAVAAREVARATGLPVGIQILAGANREALAAALASGASFIRAEGFVFGHVADEGWIESDAGALLRYRRAIGAEHVRVFVDVRKKHASHAVTADIPLAEAVRAAAFFLADGVIITGTRTGAPTSPGDLREARAATELPVLVGSGAEPASAAALLEHADALIVGSAIKEGGTWEAPVDPARARAFVEAVRGAPPP